MGKQAAILAAARAEFFGVGFMAASIERIAAAANVSKVTIYNRFQTKENLFAAMVGDECSRMRIDFDALANGGGDLREGLLAFAQSMMAFLSSADIIRFERRLAAEVDRHPAMGELFLDAGPRRIRAMLARLIAGGMASDQLAKGDPDVAAAHFYGILKGFSGIEWRFTDADEASETVTAQSIEATVDRFLRAYAP